MKKRNIILASVATLAIITAGCSGGGGSSATNVIVERGPVLASIVEDSNGQVAKWISSSKYQFATAPSYPITTRGTGVVDTNNNGIDAGDYLVKVPFSSFEKSTNLTPLTTYLTQTGVDKNTFATSIGVNVANLTKTQSEAISSLSGTERDNLLAAINSAYVALANQTTVANITTEFTNNYPAILSNISSATATVTPAPATSDNTTSDNTTNDNTTSASTALTAEQIAVVINVIESDTLAFISDVTVFDTDLAAENALEVAKAALSIVTEEASKPATSDNTTSDNTTSDNTTSDNITG